MLRCAYCEQLQPLQLFTVWRFQIYLVIPVFYKEGFVSRCEVCHGEEIMNRLPGRVDKWNSCIGIGPLAEAMRISPEIVPESPISEGSMRATIRNAKSKRVGAHSDLSLKPIVCAVFLALVGGFIIALLIENKFQSDLGFVGSFIAVSLLLAFVLIVVFSVGYLFFERRNRVSRAVAKTIVRFPENRDQWLEFCQRESPGDIIEIKRAIRNSYR